MDVDVQATLSRRATRWIAAMAVVSISAVTGAAIGGSLPGAATASPATQATQATQAQGQATQHDLTTADQSSGGAMSGHAKVPQDVTTDHGVVVHSALNGAAGPASNL